MLVEAPCSIKLALIYDKRGILFDGVNVRLVDLMVIWGWHLFRFLPVDVQSIMLRAQNVAEVTWDLSNACVGVPGPSRLSILALDDFRVLPNTTTSSSSMSNHCCCWFLAIRPIRRFKIFVKVLWPIESSFTFDTTTQGFHVVMHLPKDNTVASLDHRRVVTKAHGVNFACRWCKVLLRDLMMTCDLLFWALHPRSHLFLVLHVLCHKSRSGELNGLLVISHRIRKLGRLILVQDHKIGAFAGHWLELVVNDLKSITDYVVLLSQSSEGGQDWVVDALH